MIDLLLAFSGVIVILALLGAESIGRAVALRTGRRESDNAAPSGRTGHVLTSTFGLLALLIGFSFSIVINRYDTRRADVVAEANAIGTAHYRAGFLAGPGAGVQRSLERYARQRLVYGHTGQAARGQAETVSAQLREAIAVAGQALAPVANTPLGASSVASINEVLDISVQRETNIRAKLPWSVFAVLLGLSLVGAGMMGFAYPAGGMLRRGSSLFLFVLLTLTFAVIVDLDRPAGGGVTIDQKPMKDLVAQFAGSTEATGPAAGAAQIGRPRS